MLLDSLNTCDLRVAFLKDPLNDSLDGHLSTGASRAVSLQANLHDVVIGVLDEFDVSAVSLQKRSDLIQCFVDFFLHYMYSFRLSFVYDEMLYFY